MTQRNGTQYGTAFTVSIEAAEGVTTGISAADRARTVQTAVARDARAEDIVQPGHVFPIMAQPGGVMVRAGHTEAGCDLTAMAGLTPAAVICEIIKDDGTMARLPDLMVFAEEHGLKIGTIADLIHYRSLTESIVERVAERVMHTAHGPFRAMMYRDTPTGSPHIALVRGMPKPDIETPVRVHEPLSVLDLLEVDCSTHSWTMDAALREIAARDHGVIVLAELRRFAKEHLARCIPGVRATRTKRPNIKRRPIDFKTYGIGAQILRERGCGQDAGAVESSQARQHVRLRTRSDRVHPHAGLPRHIPRQHSADPAIPSSPFTLGLTSA
jgi:3,4-dihydroxy 2-butanone 4-phosphate synthase/GTP cyclohydrolase II